jgi:hypothetical protein
MLVPTHQSDSQIFYYMELPFNIRIGDPAKLGRDCEIHQHKHVKYSFIIWYIRMIVIVDISTEHKGIEGFHVSA